MATDFISLRATFRDSLSKKSRTSAAGILTSMIRNHGFHENVSACIAQFAVQFAKIRTSGWTGLRTDSPSNVLLKELPKVQGRWRPIEVIGKPHGCLNPLVTERSFVRPSISVHVIRNALVAYFRGIFLILADDGKVISECSGRYHDALLDLQAEITSASKDAFSLVRPAILIADHIRPSNYCHWLLDWITRIGLINPPKGAALVIDSLDTPYKFSTAHRLGYDLDDVVELAKNPLIICKELYVCSGSGTSLRHPAHLGARWALDFLRNEFIEKDLRSGEPVRLYITRSPKERRHVQNESELLELLSEYDFSIFDLRDLSVTEQAQLFHSAEMIIAPHGAGLSNLAFSRPGTRVLELMPETFGMASYPIISQMLGLDHTVAVTPVDDSTRGVRPQADNIAVDLKKISDWIKTKS